MRQTAEKVLGATFIWQEDLNEIPGLTDLLTADLEAIANEGMLAVVERIVTEKEA